MPRILLLLLLQKHLLLYLLLVQLLRGRQVEVVDDVCDVGDAVLLRSSTSCQRWISAALVSHVLLVALARRLSLAEVLVVHILHACEGVLLLIVGGDVCRACLI